MASIRGLEDQLAQPPAPGSFGEAELEDAPPIVRRYLRGSIPEGTPLARSVRIAARGSIKVGPIWLRFRARQVLTPLSGMIWAARCGGILVGSDRFVDGAGRMDWRLFGLIRVIHAEGPDTSRSTAGRIGAETMWAPTALLPRFGVTWTATGRRGATGSYRLGEVDLELDYGFDDDGRVRCLTLDRWGDAEGTGNPGLYPYGHEVTRYATFDGVTIPSAGRAGWFYGTDRWDEGEYFRYEITDLRLVT
jgi:hypothetical protein